jgi:VanZ family protein
MMIWAILFGLVTEVAQQFIPDRDMDIYDGIADTIGVIVGYYFYKQFQFKFDILIKRLGA